MLETNVLSITLPPFPPMILSLEVGICNLWVWFD